MKFYNYNDKEKRIDVFDERWYYREEKATFYRNVTTILGVIDKGFGYEEWLRNVGHNSEIIVDRAGKLGTAVHHLIELFLHEEDLSYTELAMQYGQTDATTYWLRLMVWIEFWKEFILNNKIEYIKPNIEHIVYSDKHEYAGTIDLIANVNGEIQLFDWKTGNTIGNKEQLQLQAYMSAFEETTGEQVSQANIVWIPAKKPNKKGFRIIPVSNDKDKFDLFLSTKKIFDNENKDKPKFLTYPMQVNINDFKEKK